MSDTQLNLRPGVSGALPDVLTFASGKPVKTKAEWRRRRTELLRLFAEEMYGALPPKPEKQIATVTGEYDDFLGGAGILKTVTIGFGEPDAPQVEVLLALPKRVRGKVPAFLAMNFNGNHALTADPRVPTPRRFAYKETERGAEASKWIIERILERGYAFASFCSTDIDPDKKDVSEGIYGYLSRKQGKPNDPHGRGTIAAWAWGFHRVLDYLQTERRVDSKRVAAVGHSRNGKTALLAAATDERFALAFPCQSGCGGAAPSRSTVGESVQRITTVFPHWFNTKFATYATRLAELPFDQHALIACVAPRPVLLANATEDTWANPEGQLAMLHAAAPVWKLQGRERSALPDAAEIGKLYDGTLGYFIRPGKHEMAAVEIETLLNYADRHLAK